MATTTMKDNLDKARDAIGDLHKKTDAEIAGDLASLRTRMDTVAASARQIAADLSKNDSTKPHVKQHVTAAITHLQDAAKETKANAAASFDEVKKHNTVMLRNIRDAAQSMSHAVAARRRDAKES